jgi:hypothetical protein
MQHRWVQSYRRQARAPTHLPARCDNARRCSSHIALSAVADPLATVVFAFVTYSLAFPFVGDALYQGLDPGIVTKALARHRSGKAPSPWQERPQLGFALITPLLMARSRPRSSHFCVSWWWAPASSELALCESVLHLPRQGWVTGTNRVWSPEPAGAGPGRSAQRSSTGIRPISRRPNDNGRGRREAELTFPRPPWGSRVPTACLARPCLMTARSRPCGPSLHRDQMASACFGVVAPWLSARTCVRPVALRRTADDSKKSVADCSSSTPTHLPGTSSPPSLLASGRTERDPVAMAGRERSRAHRTVQGIRSRTLTTSW